MHNEQYSVRPPPPVAEKEKPEEPPLSPLCMVVLVHGVMSFGIAYVFLLEAIGELKQLNSRCQHLGSFTGSSKSYLGGSVAVLDVRF